MPRKLNPAYPGRLKAADKARAARLKASRAEARRQRAVKNAVRERPAAVRVTPAMVARLNNAELNQLGLARMGAQVVVARPFKAPVLMPGVVPGRAPRPLPGEPSHFALDSATVAPTYTWANQFCGAVGFPGYPYLAELALRSEYRSPAETTAKEMTRRWIKLKSASAGDKSEQIAAIEEAMRNFHVRSTFRKAVEFDYYMGRYQIFLNIKGQESDVARQRPLKIDPATLGKDCLLGIKGIEPIWTTPYSYNSIDPTADDFYAPQSWFVLGRKTHASRLLNIISRPVPDLFKPAYNFGGLSMSQLMEPYVGQWYRTRDSVSDAVYNFSTSGVATNMATLLEEDQTADSLQNRAMLFNTMRGNRGLMFIDKDTEEFFQFNMPLSGLPDLQAQAQEHMAAPSHTPLVKLLGITPTGLNASSEGEIKVYYDYIHSEQESVLDVPMDIMLNVIKLHLFGDVDPDIVYEWVHMDEPTQKELSEIRTADAAAGANYIANGVIDAYEERERLQADPQSGYSNLKGGPPEMTPDEELQEAEHEHQSGEADADRDHTAEQSDKDREHSNMEAQAGREHEAEQSDKDRKTAQETAKAKAKAVPKGTKKK